MYRNSKPLKRTTSVIRNNAHAITLFQFKEKLRLHITRTMKLNEISPIFKDTNLVLDDEALCFILDALTKEKKSFITHYPMKQKQIEYNTVPISEYDPITNYLT